MDVVSKLAATVTEFARREVMNRKKEVAPIPGRRIATLLRLHDDNALATRVKDE